MTLFKKAKANQIPSLTEKHFAKCKISSSEKEFFRALKNNSKNKSSRNNCLQKILSCFG